MVDACACFENEKQEEEKVQQTKEAQKKVVGLLLS